MKIARFVYRGRESLGFVVDDEIVPFYEIEGLPAYLSYPFADEDMLESILSIKDLSPYPRISLKNVDLINPIKYPGKIICLGLNYWSHVEESGRDPPSDIILFMKPRTALAGPYEVIKVPKYVRKLDYEGELVVVIGKRGRDIPENDAYKYVFGYTILNDVSARDFQFRDGQWTRGKSFDGFAPIGPWIVTKDEISDPNDLYIRTWLNNELRQDGNTSDMIFKVPEILHRISKVMTLEPGDIISTGTPSGVGIFDKSREKLIKNGDQVRIEIEKIGYIQNKFIFI
ncbi:MAG: FAA hydrolase family protein [Thermoprotei archaeon]|nr:MAG: FAA hydrolase family protein [Thermoprotei archaeon]